MDNPSALLRANDVEGIGFRAPPATRGASADVGLVESSCATRPDYVFIRRNSTTRHETLSRTRTISTGTLNVLESVRKHLPRTAISAEAGCSSRSWQALDEKAPCGDESICRCTIQSVYAARYYDRLGPGYVGYFFTTTARASERHVSQKSCARYKHWQRQARKSWNWNIDVAKEFNYAGDVVRRLGPVNQDPCSKR